MPARRQLDEHKKRLNESFKKSIDAVTALTRYAGETFTDYYSVQNHKYKRIINNALNNLCTQRYTSLEHSLQEAIQEQAESHVQSFKSQDEKKFFLYDDRRAITNQILMAYMGYPVMQPQRAIRFIEDMTRAYTTTPQQCDAIIEEFIQTTKGIQDCTHHQDEPRQRKKIKEEGHPTIAPNMPRTVTSRKTSIGVQGKIYGLFTKNTKKQNGGEHDEASFIG